MQVDFRKAKYRRCAGPFSLTKLSTHGAFDDPGFDAPDEDYTVHDVDRLAVANLEFGDDSCAPSACLQGNAFLLAASWDLLQAATLAEELLTAATQDEQVQKTLLYLRRAISKANGHDAAMVRNIGHTPDELD